ncbi:MAG: histidine kinase dimerization/phosphoacceptor domain -containing protein [Flavobacteriales bacterium]
MEILKHPADKLAIIDWPSMHITDANEALCAFVNRSRTDLQGIVFYELFWKDVPREKLDNVTSQLNEKGFVSLEDNSLEKIIQWTRIQCDDKMYALVRIYDISPDKKNFEKALAESEKRFETFALSVTEGVAIVQDGVILDANDQLAKIYGKENHQSLQGSRLNELLSESDIQHIMASAAISAVNRNDVRITDAFGRTVFLEITGSYTDYKRKRSLVLVFNDISAVKRNEQALQQSLLSFQRLLEDSPNGVGILTEGRIQYLNQAACKLFSIEDEDEVFGDVFMNFIEESHRDVVLKDLQIVRSGGEVPNKEIKMLNAEKVSVEVEIKSTLTVYENKPSTQVTLNNISDRAKLLQEQVRVRFVEEINSALKAEIDEHRATQLKLEQQQRQTLEQTAKIEAIFNSTENLLMWTLNHDFRITAINKNFIKEMKSVFQEDVSEGDDVRLLLEKHIDKNFYQGQLQSFSNGFKGRPQQFELPLLNANGQTVWWQCFLNPVYLNGQLEELSCLVYDNTDRKEIERKVRDSLKEKEVLLQEVHHRVKNNLQVISSILNLQTSYVSDPHTLEILRESQQRIKSMSFIHETIYRTADFSRLEFMDYIKTIASNLIQSYRTVSTTVQFEPDMESVGLNIDQAIPCGLIINELVSNALKYAFKGRKSGRLIVLLKEKDNEIQLAVKDDGVGLPKDFAYEKNNSLGIQLVYALLEQLDATMEVNQEKGTEFFIRFHRK